MNKKAAINISVRFIVILIIALVILLLLIALIRYLFGESSIRLEEELSRYAKPPMVIISSPSPAGIYTVFQNLKFDGSKSYDRYFKIVGYFWDFDSDSIIDSRKKIDYFYYPEPGEYNLTLKAVNEPGAIGSASQIVRVVTNNRKREDIKNSLFLIRDNERDNEETILRLIPVITWWDKDGLHTLPYYVYYVSDAGSSLEVDQLKGIMESYGKEHAYVFDDVHIPCPNTIACDPPIPLGIKCCDLGDGKRIVKVNDKIDDVYFDFWELYEYVVLVNRNESDDKLIASLFAAYYNSPIIFIDSSNLGGYREDIINLESGPTQRIYYVPSIEEMDRDVDDWVTTRWDRKTYSGEELRTGNVNRIIRLTSNVTMHAP